MQIEQKSLEARIAELEAEKQKRGGELMAEYQRQLDLQLAPYNAAIGELQRLMKLLEAESPPEQPAE
jgi:hypothetical protein